MATEQTVSVTGYTERQVLQRLEELKRTDGGLTKASRRLGVSPSFLCDVLARRCPLGPSLLKPLGLKKVVIYELADADAPA